MGEDFGKRLIFPVKAMPGEGLAELVFRASAENCFLNTLNIMKLAGIPGIHAGSIGSGVAGREGLLAHILGPNWSAEAVAAIAFQPDERVGWHSWFGTSIRRIRRMAKTRRVAPRSLSGSLHLKAVWSLKPFCFDPDTREMLLGECPVCGNQFGCRCSFGVQFCDRCSRRDDEGFIRGAVDLRDFPQPLIEVDDDEGLSVVTGLIHPDANRRSTTLRSLPDQIREFGDSQLFELCVNLASALSTSPTSGTGRAERLRSVADYRRITPEILARTGRVLLGWPHSFHDFMAEVHNGWDQRPGNYGVRKTLGPFTEFERNGHLDPRLRDIFQVNIASSLARTEARPLVLSRASKENSDLITLQSAKRKFRTSQSVLAAAQQAGISTFRAKSGRKSPVLVSVTELGNVLAARADLLTPLAAARRLGLPILALPHLARANLVNAVETAGGCLPRYSRHSVDELVARLKAQTTTGPVPAQTSTLCAAAVQLGAPNVSPWAGLLEAVLDGRIPTWRSKVKQPVAMSLFVNANDARKAVKAFDMWASDGDDPVLTGPCVASMLGLYLVTVRSLMRQGLLSETPTLSELQVFSRAYLSTRQVRDILRTHSSTGKALSIQARIDCRILPSLLQILGLKPLPGCKESERNFFWKRAEIDRLAAEWPRIGGMFADLQPIQAP